MEPLIVDLIPGPAYSWESQAAQYAPKGTPGIDFEQHLVDMETGEEVMDLPASMAGPLVTVIDCLLYRDDDGVLIGILNHYDGKNPIEKAGAVNIWVRPDWQQRGIATALTEEAVRRWDIKPDNQRYTQEGLFLLRSLLRRQG